MPEIGGLLVVFLVLTSAIPSAARKKDAVAYGEGLIVNIPLPEPEVAAVVQDIASNGIIRGTKEYNKDEFVAGAVFATSSTVFPEWKQAGKVFYKVRTGALDPRNFKDSQDLGTLVVRYLVQPQGTKNTVLRIDALFKEDFRHVVHLSNGSVESDEYRDIQDHLDFLELMKKQDVEASRERQEQVTRKNAARQSEVPAAMPTESSSSNTPQVVANSPAPVPVQTASATPVPVTAEAPPPNVAQVVESSPVAPQEIPSAADVSLASAPQPGQSLEEHVKDLRSQVERLVKAPGAPLKSAPFHTALNLQTLTAGTQVLILISTPYWYGVETHQGQHGWIMRDELEQLP